MPTSSSEFVQSIQDLKGELAQQGLRVQRLLEMAFESAFAHDLLGARHAVEMDDVIDKVDVDIEKRAVALLTEACAVGAALGQDSLRMVLTIVKVNNELERIADAGVSIAEMVPEIARNKVVLAETFRVMTNSVIGILRDACVSLDRLDGQLAKIVLASEDAVEAFKRAIMRDAQVQVSAGKISVDAAFLIQAMTTSCEIMAGHCTNIAEQALYVATGKIVRHMAGHWEEVPQKI